MKTISDSTEVPSPNSHIREYLKHYFSFQHAPGYAVLLSGPWGIGKTFLIKKLLEEQFKEREEEYVYLSLYGLTSIEEINEALLAAIYPALEWKGVKIAGRVMKAALSFGGIETDYKLVDFLGHYKAKLFVFDDLERCELKPINKVLGYINEFIEHDGCKVLIIANEEEIEDGAEYRRRREKLVGKTLHVQSSFDEAIAYFISTIDDADTKKFVQEKAADISATYYQSKLHNLRILQQTIWDFERVYRVLSPRHRANNGAMTILLKMFFALSFELKAGRITEDALGTRMGGLVAAMTRLNNEADPMPLQFAEKNYPDIDLGDSIMSDQLLIDILSRGVVDKEAIHESLDRSPYFVDPANEPPWRALWHSLDQTDADFDRAFKEMERQYAAREFTVIGEILHVFGLRLWLSDIGVIAGNRAEIVQEGKAYIDDLYAQKRLDPIPFDHAHDFRFDCHDGLGMHEAATPEYRALVDYLKNKCHLAGVDRYPDQGEKLLEELASDPALYYRRLCVTHSDDNIYHRIPILAAIDPIVFIGRLLKQAPAQQRTILSAFKGRYEHGDLERDLASERPWLIKVRELLLKAGSMMPAIAKYRIQKNVEWYIDPFL